MRSGTPYVLTGLTAIATGCLAMAIAGEGMVYEVGAWLTIITILLALAWFWLRHGGA